MRGRKDWDDTDYMPELHGAMRRGAGLFAHLLLIVIAVFFVTFFYWAQRASLEEVTRGDGTVIPSGQIQVVQNLEGGIVAAINVREGDLVEKGQVLVKIENVLAASDYRGSRTRYFALSAAAARLDAEVAGAKSITFPDEIVEETPEFAARERALFAARGEGLRSELAILRQQERQRKQELLELRSRLNKLTGTHQLALEELQMTEPMARSGVVPQIDVLRLRRTVNDLEGDRESTRLAIPRVQAALAEASRRVQGRVERARSEALQELTKTRADLAAISEVVTAEKDRVVRTDVRSPTRGTVKQLFVNTIGGVIRPGEDLAEIVPIEDTLLIEAKIRPSDVAFLRPGLEATVKITAYDFSIYGGLPATLEEISADTITDENGDKFYRIRLRTERNYLGTEAKPLPIIAGMTASVDILTGEKTVLDYILKPILKAKSSALRER
jgi:adhesin transport system membrane fusion protein